MHYIIHTDGSCWPNPGGPIGYGFTIKTEGHQWAHHGSVVAHPGNTNNMAEFSALYEAFAYAVERIGLQPGDVLDCYSDSQIMVNLLSGLYTPNPEKSYFKNYFLCYGLVKEYRRRGIIFNFHWIPREQNQECDDLSKASQPPKQKQVSDAVLKRAQKKMRKDLALRKIKDQKPIDIWAEMAYSIDRPA